MEEQRVVRTFSGGDFAKFDSKNRLTIRVQFQRVLNAIGAKTLFVTFGLEPKKQRLLEIWPDKYWRQFAAKIIAESKTVRGLGIRDYDFIIQNYINPALELVPDKQWRIVLPAPLRKYLGISTPQKGEQQEESDLYLIGSGKCMKLMRFEDFIALRDEEGTQFDGSSIMRKHNVYYPEEDYYADTE